MTENIKIDLVEQFESTLTHIPDADSVPDTNPNPFFGENESHNSLNFIPEVKTRKNDRYSDSDVLEKSLDCTDLEYIMADAQVDLARYLRNKGYDLKVMNEIIEDGHGIGFCLGNIRTHVDKFSHEKSFASLFEIIHYASVAVHILNQEAIGEGSWM